MREKDVLTQERLCYGEGEKKSLNASKKPQFISVVAYVHNVSDKVTNFIETVMNCCLKTFKQCEVIFVDDYSTDDSVDVIREYYNTNSVDYGVSVVRMGRYHGMETAMNAGRDMSVGDYVYEFDSLYIDFDEEVIIEAYEKCIEGNDIVTVSTDVPLRMTSKLFYKVFNKVVDSRSQIGQETFRILSRRGINRITTMDVNIPYRKVIYLNSGLSTAQICYKSITGERPPRITKKYERFNLAFDSFIYFTNIVERIALSIASIFSALSILIIIYAIITNVLGVFNGGIGFYIILFVSIGFVGIFGLMVLVIKYLSVLINLVFENQKYLIAGIDKIS